MLRTLNLPDHDPLINDMFSDFDETIFNNICLEQPWMSDGFDQLPDANVSNDDLLTDAVSEILKCRTDLPCSDFHNSSDDFSDVVVGDEVGINATLLASPTHQANKREHQVDSSGYTSGTVTSTYLSPSNSTSSQVASPLSVDLAQPSNVSNASIQISSDYPIQRKNILQASLFKRSDETEPPILTSKRTFNKREFTPGNRVHLILHHNPSSIKLNNTAIHSNGSDPERGKTGVFYLNKSLSQQSDIVYPCSDEKRFTESPMLSGSHSSSDSDMKDNSDDDQMTNLSYSKYEEPYGHEHTSQPRSSTNFTRAVSSFKRTASPLSKFSNLKYGYDEETGYNYPQTARIISQNLFRSQLSSSRIRSPVRLDRNDPGLLTLTSEEKRTLIAEGYTIPTRLPLTKQEERNLKKVRRKIKNKISAQESRRKKKEYLETLERKVSVYSQENVELRRRVDSLENTNRSLLGQLRLLQQLVNKSKSSASSNSASVASAKPSISVSSNPPATSGHKSSTGQQQCAPGNGLVSVSTAASGGAGAGSGGGSEGGPSSTCLMVFALCFVALLVGQPLQPVSQSNTGTALYSVASQIFTSRLLGSTSQVGYSWSPPSHRWKGRPNQLDPFQSTWLARQYFHWMGSGQLRHHGHLPASTCAVDGDAAEPAVVGRQAPDGDGMTEPGSLGTAQATRQTGVTGTVSQPTMMGEWKSAEPRSRLLGSPSELAECSAPPRRSLWSYLFGGSDGAGSGKSTLGGICTQLEYATGGDDDAGLDSVSRNWLPEPATFSAEPEASQQLNRSKATPKLTPLRSDTDRHVTNLSNAFISARSSGALVSA